LSNPIQAVPVRHPGRWLAAAVILVLAAMLAHTLVTNENFHWDVVGRYLTTESILNGLKNTLILTALSMAIGIVGGIGLAVMRLASAKSTIPLFRKRKSVRKRNSADKSWAPFPPMAA